MRLNVLPGPKGAEKDKLALAQYASVASIPSSQNRRGKGGAKNLTKQNEAEALYEKRNAYQGS
ncbi:hypothetical protein [Legionella fallonii]|uniref:Uncharacterized protein n=1 Tax=Legionella fallonii LLAP-10 TaxID=1212491 RepID=A0A098G1F3_9GAMM|nr:hypothetical protein [Legionella fallonii]CEG56297.1 protein of unknown function [Legionella fallonii LLAP-10]